MNAGNSLVRLVFSCFAVALCGPGTPILLQQMVVPIAAAALYRYRTALAPVPTEELPDHRRRVNRVRRRSILRGVLRIARTVPSVRALFERI